MEILFASQREIRLQRNNLKGNTVEIVFAAQKEIRLRRNKVTQSDLGLLFRKAYFTERSEVYFNCISIIFRVEEPISTVFRVAYFTERSEVYFNCISTVFLSFLTFAT